MLMPRDHSWRTPLHSDLQQPAVGGILLAGLAHLPPLKEHLLMAPAWGVLFGLFTLICAVLAIGIGRRDTPLGYTAVGVTSLMAISTYVLSRLVALPQIADDVHNWGEPWGMVSITAEVYTLIVSVMPLVAWRRR